MVVCSFVSGVWLCTLLSCYEVCTCLGGCECLSRCKFIPSGMKVCLSGVVCVILPSERRFEQLWKIHSTKS